MAAEKRKLLIVAILELLRKHTDETHKLRQAPLLELMEREMGMPITRKTLRQNLADLQLMGYPVRFKKGWYYDATFSAQELDYIIDCILCSGAASQEQHALLIDKLKTLRSKYYQPQAAEDRVKPANAEFMSTMAVLRQAIDEGRQVSFHYADYDVDKALHLRKAANGRTKIYKINPYRTCTVNGRYYLICNVDKYDSLCHFRIDRILDAKQLKSAAKPLSKVKDGEDTLDLPGYVNDHPYMYSGKPAVYTLRINRCAINDLLDWFGLNVEFSNVKEKTADVTLRSDPVSMKLWLARYGDNAELI